MKHIPEYCDDCIYYGCKPHPYKGWIDSCELCMQCLDDDQEKGWIYDGNGRPTNCPLTEVDDLQAESEYSTIEELEQEPKTGHWIRFDENKLRCSECEVIHLIAQYPMGEIKFCPNCGTKMVESEENKMTKEQLEYATKINHDINMLEEQFDIDKFIAENIAEKLGELQRQFES